MGERLRLFHMIFGFVCFIVFLMTGQYMDKYYGHLSEMDDLPRALMRMQHLYILFAALLHILLGAYYKKADKGWDQLGQGLGSFLMGLATIVLIFSFFKELPTHQIERPLCRMALYGMFAGVMGHGLPALMDRLNFKSVDI